MDSVKPVLLEEKLLAEDMLPPTSLQDLGYKPQAYKETKFNLLRPKSNDFFATVNLLFRWRGSIWEGIWKQLAVFLCLFFFINFLYRFCLTGTGRSDFEKLSATFTFYLDQGTIPLAFVLGFYVQTVYSRWWQMWITVPWIDRLALTVYTGINMPRQASNQDKKELHKLVLIKKSILRYISLGFALASRKCSSKMEALYPAMESMVRDGLLTDSEYAEFERTSKVYLHHQSDWWIPFTWATGLAQECHERKMSSPQANQDIMREITGFRDMLGHMFDFGMMGVPLIYTQLATIATYLYFFVVLIGRAQFLDPSKQYDGNLIDFGLPIFSIMEFVIFVGWLQVASKMLDPYGLAEDDAAFDLHWVLHRNVEVGNVIVSRTERHPKLERTFPLSGIGARSSKAFGGADGV